MNYNSDKAIARLTIIRGRNVIEEKLEQAGCLERDKNWKEALAIYKELALLYPKNIKIMGKTGWCLSRLRLYDEAIKVFNSLMEMEPKLAKWPYMIGYQYYDQQDYIKAIEWFRNALQLHPDYLIVKYRLGYALTQVCGTVQKLKKPEYLEAFRQFQECKNLWEKMPPDLKNQNKSTYGDVCFQLAKIFMERKDYENAIDNFKTSIIYNPCIERKYGLSKALYERGLYDDALENLPKDKSKYYIVELEANIFFKKGNSDKALEILLADVKRRNKDYIHRHLSEIYLNKEDIKKAFFHIQNAIKINPNNHINHLTLANIFYKLGLLISAKYEAEKASELKIRFYGSEYSEANQLLSLINSQIETSNYLKDDEDILSKLLHDETEDNKDTILKGIITKYNSAKGYGFINSNSNSYFFHISDVKKTQQSLATESKKVSFKVVNTKKGLAANDVTIIL
jgi:tetratricopeptide (TPR) repeat protein